MFGNHGTIRFPALAALLALNALPSCAGDRIPAALLWIPGPDSDVRGELEAVAALEDARITVALDPERLPQTFLPRMDELMQNGTLELALRVPGDPPLPLLFSPDSPEVNWQGKKRSGLWSPRLDILASSVFQARERHLALYGHAPSGFVPAGGGAIPQMVEPLSAYEMSWMAVGQAPGKEFELLYSSGVYLLPFRKAGSAEDAQSLLDEASAGETGAQAQTETEDSAATGDAELPSAELPGPSVLAPAGTEPSAPAEEPAPAQAAPERKAGPVVFMVVDDSLPGAQHRAPLSSFFSHEYENAEPQWMTLSSSSLCQLSTATLDAARFPLPWTGDYTLWAGTLEQRAALYTIGELRRDINVYANSHSGGHVGAKLSSGMAQLERGDSLLLLASTQPAVAAGAEEAFRQKVAALYRQANLQVPQSLRSALSDTALDQEQAQPSTGTVTMKAGNSYITFSNPLKTVPIPPAYRTLPGGPDPQQLFNLQSVTVEWTDKTLKFRLRNRRLSRQDRQLLPHILLADIYIDINHRRNSGTGTFLPGRRLSPNPEDAWEYALSIADGKAQVYKTSLSGIQAGRVYNAFLDHSGDLVAEIPRSEFRGNPKLWGYTMLVMGSSGSGADRAFTPVQLSAGDAVVDYLASDNMGSTLTALRFSEGY